jgi:hypothetical protein
MPPRVWVVGPTEGPAFCLILDPKGNARFIGGFADLGAVKWGYDTAKGELAITMVRMDSSLVRLFQGAVGKQLLGFDSVTHTAVYNTVLGETLWFAGYTLFRRSALDSSEYARAPRQCRRP